MDEAKFDEKKFKVALAGVGVVPSNVDAFVTTALKGGERPEKFTGEASKIGELAAAGVDLAKIVMVMISVAAFILIIMALQAESTEMAASNKTVELALAVAPLATPVAEDKQLSGVLSALRQAATNPALVLPPVEIENARLVINKALKLPAITGEQKSSLDNKCIPLPLRTLKDRALILERCAATLETVFIPPAADAQRLALIKELQKSQAEERTARRAHWMQIAQLVLINLLLPILTALLGYIFGTQQAS